jgi:hypothetical protein
MAPTTDINDKTTAKTLIICFAFSSFCSDAAISENTQQGNVKAGGISGDGSMGEL